MQFDFDLFIRGERACFTQGAFGAERFSSTWPTPSAMAGLLKAIYWKPEIDFQIAAIGLVRPGRREQMTRVELKSRQGTEPGAPDRTLRSTSYLVDVAYRLRFRIVMAGVPVRKGLKHQSYVEQMRRRLEQGGHFQQPYLGLREFAASVELANSDDPAQEPLSALDGVSIGQLLGGFAYVPGNDLTFWRKGADGERRMVSGRAVPVFFDAEIRDGWIEVPESLYQRIQAMQEGCDAA